MSVDSTSVKVAVRVRPLVKTEIERGCQEVVDVISENEQIVLKSLDKAFTFNYVLGSHTEQHELYERCVAPLLNKLFEGFNVTIFAYGQTGSGKTHSMGTTYSEGGNMGVIPRAVNEIFNVVKDQFSIDFTISVSFIELYREVLYDLLAGTPRDQCTLEIREDPTKGLYIPNLTEVPVDSAQQILSVLMKGSQGRATASTNMNATSSRSHSIFTVNLAMQHKTEKNQNKMAKLHLVDLAGSERPKKTGAQGTTFKEGVDINKGLFVLGNVISALGDEKTHNYVPYRDSNLTRLLKDSLGGNSVTLMIACISPADYNLEETLSTLRYADRARKIKNKPIVNQDPKTAEINDLKKQIKLLQLQIVGQGGPIISTDEIDLLKSEIRQLNIRIAELKTQLSTALLDKTGLHEKLLILQNAIEVQSKKVSDLKIDYNATFSQISQGFEQNDVESVKENVAKLAEIQKHFEGLQNDQIKTEDELRNHEETFTVLIHAASNQTAVMPKDIQEKEESHRTTQLALNSQLQEVSKQLALKEQLAWKLAANIRHMVDEQCMLETEQKIETLEKEKNELLQQLKNVKSQENSQKLSEKRRRRVQELEDQLNDLKKKVQEQSKLIKLKKNDEQKIKQLNNEIVAMKTEKVKLFKQMREEADKFRILKQQSQRELARVKHQDRKKATEMAKMKVTHEKQKNVLKRKFEEAAALNKRLQNMLVKRKQAQETKFSNKTEKIASWLKEELEVHSNLAEAQAILDGLLEDRAILQRQLDELKSNPETANGVDVKNIESDLELRSVQIQDLQQKLLDSDEDNKSKVRFDAVQTMVEAKFALKSIFVQAAEYCKNMVQIRRENTELHESQKELNEKIEHLMKERAQLQDNFAEQLSNTEREYQEKIGILLNQIRGIKNEDISPESELQHRCQIQEEKIAHQQSIIQQKEETIEKMNKKIQAMANLAATTQTLPNEIPKKKLSKENLLKELNLASEKTPTNRPALQDKTSNSQNEEEFVFIENIMSPDEDLENDASFVDNIKNDPDWRNTPLGKRVINEKRNKLVPVRSNVLDSTKEPDKLGGSKRSSGGGCTCKGSCRTSRCGCRRIKRTCSSACKCSDSCENSDVSETEGSSNVDQQLQWDSIESVESNNSSTDEHFKRPRIGDDIPNKTKVKKNRFTTQSKKMDQYDNFN